MGKDGNFFITNSLSFRIRKKEWFLLDVFGGVVVDEAVLISSSLCRLLCKNIFLFPGTSFPGLF